MSLRRKASDARPFITFVSAPLFVSWLIFFLRSPLSLLLALTAFVFPHPQSLCFPSAFTSSSERRATFCACGSVASPLVLFISHFLVVFITISCTLANHLPYLSSSTSVPIVMPFSRVFDVIREQAVPETLHLPQCRSLLGLLSTDPAFARFLSLFPSAPLLSALKRIGVPVARRPLAQRSSKRKNVERGRKGEQKMREG